MLASVFLNPANAAWGIAAKGLPLLGVCAIFFALNITFIGYYQSVERSGRAILYMLLRSLVFLLPPFLILPGILGTPGLWLSIPASEFLTFCVVAALYLRSRRRCA